MDVWVIEDAEFTFQVKISLQANNVYTRMGEGYADIVREVA